MSEQNHRIQEQSILSPVGGIALYLEFHRSLRTDVRPLGTVVLVHGLAEHLGRYGHVIEAFIQRGYQVLAYDQRGHGRSGATRCHVDSFDDYGRDLQRVLRIAQEDGFPIFVLGHSMGALVVLWYLATLGLKSNEEIPIQAAALIGVPLKPQVEVPRIKEYLGLLMSRIYPKARFHAGLNPRYLARNPEVGEAYANDPLVIRTVTAGWFHAFNRATLEIPGMLREGDVPALFLHGGDDRIVHPDGSRVLFEAYPDPRKQIHIYEGCYHELLNEACYLDIVDEIHIWFQNATAATHNTMAAKINL